MYKDPAKQIEYATEEKLNIASEPVISDIKDNTDVVDYLKQRIDELKEDINESKQYIRELQERNLELERANARLEGGLEQLSRPKTN